MFVSPIKVFNHTGYEIEVFYYKKKLIIKEDNVPDMKNYYNQSLIVRHNESVPLNIYDASQEEEELGEKIEDEF